MTARRPCDPQASLTMSGGCTQLKDMERSETLKGLGARVAAGDD